LTEAARRRLRARRTIEALTAFCVVAALAIGSHELVTGGLKEFLDRPPGVGASESDIQAPNQVAEAPSVTPKPAVLVPNAVLPNRAASDRRARHRH